jgi:hypothetical protein
MPNPFSVAFEGHFAHAISRPFSISNPADRVSFIEGTLVFWCQHGLALLRRERRRGSFGK